MIEKKHPIDALTTDPIDDRWTLSKLCTEGYEHRGDGPCKTCGASVSFYKRERAPDYKGYARWLVVDPASLEVHRCQGTSRHRRGSSSPRPRASPGRGASGPRAGRSTG